MSYYSTILADTPTIYYRLNESSGTVAHDFSGNSNNGTLYGTITYSQTGAIAGDSDTALAFDYAGGISIPSGINPLTWSALTLEFWINTGSGFQYVVVTTDNAGGATTIYLNGSAVTPGSTAAILIGQDLSFAGSGNASTFDEVALYNYKLTTDQITNHYNAALGTGTTTGVGTPIYSYGSFQINASSGGRGYFLIAKDLDFPVYKPSLSPVARYDGWKITGWQVSERNIQVDIVVLGTSRVDCVNRLDTLFQALSLRDQNLVLHEDGRYWVANATAGKVKFSAGTGIVQARVPVIFLCADPYPKAASAATPYDTGALTYTLSGNAYNSPTFTIAGGGTVYSWPQLHLIHKTPSQGFTTLTSALTTGQQYQSLSVASAPALTTGQILTLYFAPGGTATLNTQKVTVSQNVSATSTTIPVNTFTAAWPFTTGTFVYVSTAWNQITVSQLTDNYTLSVSSTTAAPLPQTFGDFLDIFCDPSTGMYIATNGLSPYLDFVGAFPPLEAANTQWQVSIGADYQPTVDAIWSWTPRMLS